MPPQRDAVGLDQRQQLPGIVDQPGQGFIRHGAAGDQFDHQAPPLELTRRVDAALMRLDEQRQVPAQLFAGQTAFVAEAAPVVVMA